MRGNDGVPSEADVLMKRPGRGLESRHSWKPVREIVSSRLAPVGTGSRDSLNPGSTKGKHGPRHMPGARHEEYRSRTDDSLDELGVSVSIETVPLELDPGFLDTHFPP